MVALDWTQHASFFLSVFTTTSENNHQGIWLSCHLEPASCHSGLRAGSHCCSFPSPRTSDRDGAMHCPGPAQFDTFHYLHGRTNTERWRIASHSPCSYIYALSAARSTASTGLIALSSPGLGEMEVTLRRCQSDSDCLLLSEGAPLSHVFGCATVFAASPRRHAQHCLLVLCTPHEAARLLWAVFTKSV